MTNLLSITMYLTATLALGLLLPAMSEDVYCLSLQDCQKSALDTGIASTYFYADDCKSISGCGEVSTETMDVTTKGCFMKTSSTGGIKKAFFFLGDGKAMTAEVSPPRQARLYCGTTPPTPPTPTPPTPTPVRLFV